MRVSIRDAPSPSSSGGRVDVSVLVPVLNEERHIRVTVAAMQAQRFDGTIELLFADGRSQDRTREILLELAADDPHIRVFENPRRIAASGLNVCLREARGEFIARMDAHTVYSDRYLADGVQRLERGDTAWVSGPTVPRSGGPVAGAFTLALASWLGRGGSRRWGSNTAEAAEWDLDTGVFCGVWRRETLLDIGGWDERWPINEDSEMAARFLQRGERLVCLSEMAGAYMPRDSLWALARQYFRYGFYRARTFRHREHGMRLSHLIAPALVCVLGAAVVAPPPLRRVARVAAVAYATGVGATGANAVVRPGQRRDGAMLLAVLPIMHISWGLGALIGTVRFGPPIATLKHLTGVGRDGAVPDGAESVYAPSLHEQTP